VKKGDYMNPGLSTCVCVWYVKRHVVIGLSVAVESSDGGRR
jgi:hypothetical protein